MSITDAGWGWPLNMRKAHYFPALESMSLCRRVMYMGMREDDKHESVDNCAECRRVRERRERKAGTDGHASRQR